MLTRFFGNSLCAAIAALLLLPGFQASASSNVLRFYNEISPPYYFLDDNSQAKGANVDLANAIIRHANVDATIEHLPWARAVHDAIHNPNIVLMSILKTPQRAEQFRWLGPVHDVNAAMFVLASRHDLQQLTLERSKTLTVGTIRGYGAAQYLQNQGFEEKQNLVLVSTSRQLWSMLVLGRLDAVLSNAASGRYELLQMGLPSHTLRPAFEVEELSLTLQMATGLNTPKETADALQSALNTIRENGEFSRIMSKWRLIE